jgi:hypothetical protein
MVERHLPHDRAALGGLISSLLASKRAYNEVRFIDVGEHSCEHLGGGLRHHCVPKARQVRVQIVDGRGVSRHRDPRPP